MGTRSFDCHKSRLQGLKQARYKFVMQNSTHNSKAIEIMHKYVKENLVV